MTSSATDLADQAPPPANSFSHPDEQPPASSLSLLVGQALPPASCPTTTQPPAFVELPPANISHPDNLPHQALTLSPLSVSPCLRVEPFPPLPPSGVTSDPQLLSLWLSLKTSRHTRRAYASDTAHFLAFVHKPLASVTLTDLTAWATHLAQLTHKPATTNRALTAVKSLLSFAQESGYLPYNVGVAVKLQPQRDSLAQRILAESEVAKLIDAAPEGRDRVILKLLYVSGVRVSELCGLKWCDTLARQQGGQISVFGKGGKTRTVLLKPKVWQQLLSIRREAQPLDPIFPSRKGHGPLDVSQVRRIVYAAARKAGLAQKVSPHWMRHAHASHALDRSAPIHLVQATLGHASVATTGRYLHARPSESSGDYLPD